MRFWKFILSLPQILALALGLSLAFVTPGSTALAIDSQRVDVFRARLTAEKVLLPQELEIYESARSVRSLSEGPRYKATHGWNVVERDGNGDAKRVQVRLLIDNPGLSGRVQVIGPFNNWGKSLRPGDTLTAVSDQPELFGGVIDGLKHGMSYRLMVDGRQLLDPSATMFTTREYLEREGTLAQGDYLNSIFWDHQDPRQYKMKSDTIDLHRHPVVIAEVELHSLVKNFASKNGQTGPRSTAETYRFIAESGVIQELKNAGYNTVEMLPFNQSMDGDSWHLRYQVFGLFAPDSRYGNPGEFKMMIDAFHKAGMAVVMDAVISHFPFHGNKGDRHMEGIGLDQWTKADGRPLFAGDKSPWDTYRYDYANPYLRRYLIDSVLYMMGEYKIDGIRFDNVDGITATNGGIELMRELTTQVREYFPRSFLIAESFSPPQDLLHRVDKGGFGMNTRNDGNLFNIWHHQAQSSTEALDISAFSHALRDPWDWKSVPLLRYLTNHDESANGRGGFTGQYPASLIGESYYAFNKVKVFDTFNMFAGSYHLSLPQARMGQTGSFYSNPAIEWGRIKNGSGKQLWDYFANLARFIGARPSSFNFESLNREIEHHRDEANKVLSIRRVDPTTGREIYALLNFGHAEIRDYRFGVNKGGRYQLVHDSDTAEFGGQDRLKQVLPGGAIEADSLPQHGQQSSLKVPVLPPYGALIFESSQ